MVGRQVVEELYIISGMGGGKYTKHKSKDIKS